MDKLENQHKPEEMPDFVSKPHKQFSEIATQANVQKDGDTEPGSEQRWKRLIHWLRSSTFTPEWLPAPWNHPVLSYICALLIPMGTMILALLLRQIFLTFIFPGVLIIIATLIVAFLWGTGPGLLATLWGTILFNIIVLSPQYSLSLNLYQDAFETCFLLVIGIIISLVVGRIEHVRAEAVAARLEIEKLVTQLEAEKHALGQAQQLAIERASEIEAIIEAMADGVYVYDSQGQLIRTNAAAQNFSPLFRQSKYLAHPFPERISSFLAHDEYRQPLENSDLPLTRVLRGEMLTGSDTADTMLFQQNGTEILLNISGAPVRDNDGQDSGSSHCFA